MFTPVKLDDTSEMITINTESYVTAGDIFSSSTLTFEVQNFAMSWSTFTFANMPEGYISGDL